LVGLRPSSSASLPDFEFDHGAISVPDLNESIAWFERVLGFSVVRRFRLEAAQADCAMLGRDNLRIELFAPDHFIPLSPERREPNQDVQLLGNKHVAFRCEDLDGLIAWFERQGADVALRVDASFGRAVFVRDNAGNLIEFVARAPVAGAC
jgi:catechol 2,3-dioxygenase-like lactoylglutathione lyase family enzyme